MNTTYSKILGFYRRPWPFHEIIFKQRRQTPVRSYVRTRSHPTDGRDANRIGERRRGDGDGDDVERDGWKERRGFAEHPSGVETDAERWRGKRR